MTRKEKIADLDRQIDELRKARHEALLSGVQSASLGSAGASQSYTKFKIAEYDAAINSLVFERNALLRGGRRRTSPDFGV